MKFFVTTPIYYATAPPHIGSAYSTLAADIFARFHRQIGDETFFLTGTDEHGSKIAEAAERHHLPVKEFVDQIAESYISLWTRLDISYDRFIRTTEADHIKVVQDFLNRLYALGYIYAGKYSGLYCHGCESFKKPSELVEGKCPDHDTIPETVTEDTYFFRLSEFKDKLINLIAHDQLIIQPTIRKNEVLSFLENNDLEDLSISRRSVTWGIPLPWDQSHTSYVWVDALINYYTAGKKSGFWPPIQQILAKDILRFHAVVWPAMLLAAGEEPPKHLFVHGFLTSGGQKMSKTIGNIVDPATVTKDYSPDGLRYYLFNAFTFGDDGDFSSELLNRTYNTALSNELGNLVQRVIIMDHKYYQGLVPKHKEAAETCPGAIVAKEAWQQWFNTLNSYNINNAFETVWRLVRFANRRIDETRPWELAKTDKDRLQEVIYELLETINQISLMLNPLLPGASAKIRQLLNANPIRKQTFQEYQELTKWGGLRPGSRIMVGEKVLFPRHDN